ncbi:penicillin acylase family protein [Cellulomonas bogoriensis]|uniref:Penicillin amidase n=1 Tax=Cellulomonas bogoriensis 69B4 = DSM 16987 TaxID=1386082 RepID=A0A0A0BUE7_9CELL|nr:penicillin acylase family protein [Cellulomonas bogoriensis]KGM10729.1 penicillin amidase [Cellulomonas bogoriensis 69B4 = DSM 16987]
MPRRHAARRALVVVAALVVLALVAAVALAATVMRRPLPDRDGAVDVAGLSAQVDVLRDEQGVPHLFADTAEDLFFAQGYVHAQERFFQMDYRRHVTAGRLSELVGADADALASDRVVRAMGWRAVAEQEWDLLAPGTQAYLTAYADGVNAYLGATAPEALAVEYTVLGARVDLDDPEPWNPVDSLAWLKAMAWDLRSNYDHELSRALTYATVRDVDRVEELFPRYPYDRNAPILSGDDVRTVASPAGVSLDLDADLVDALEATERALDALPTLVAQGEGRGSNSWVVSGEHTASGSPILAADPHLALSAPGVWTQMGLHCREAGEQCPFEVSGFTFAGFPGVIVGHNADLAWGLSNLGADVTDFFLHRTDPEAGTYERDGEDVPFDVRTEVIEINGAAPVEFAVRSTVHGPILSDVLDLGRVTGSPAPEVPRRSSIEVALGWTALEPGATADAIFMLNTASDAEDVAEAAAALEVPSQNIVFATTDGQIGYQAPGRVPVRARVGGGPVPADGTWPRPGWDSRYDWQGFVDADDMPAVVDPPGGVIVAANQPVTPRGAGPVLAEDWDYGYRAQRIRTLLERQVEAGEPVDVESTAALQMDSWSPQAELLVPALLEVPVDAFTREGVDLLRDWDYTQEPDSAAAAYFASVWSNLLELTFQDDLPHDQWPSGDSRWIAVVTQLMDDPGNAWWDDRRTVNVVESRDEILARSLTAARLELTVSLGKTADEWQWGRLHTARPLHPVLGGEDTPRVIRSVMNPSPVGVGGGSSAVNATSWHAATGGFEVDSGPSMRMVVDLGDLDSSRWVDHMGVSGHPASPNYGDQLEPWARGETFPWPFSRAAVEEAATRTLTLRPGS